jgi:hypothetical protein
MELLRGVGFRLSENDLEAKKANFDEGVNENFENCNWDGENGFCEAECQGSDQKETVFVERL